MTETQIIALAKTYYPTLWTDAMLKALVAASPQRLSPEGYQTITGNIYSA